FLRPRLPAAALAVYLRFYRAQPLQVRIRPDPHRNAVHNPRLRWSNGAVRDPPLQCSARNAICFGCGSCRDFLHATEHATFTRHLSSILLGCASVKGSAKMTRSVW